MNSIVRELADMEELVGDPDHPDHTDGHKLLALSFPPLCQ